MGTVTTTDVAETTTWTTEGLTLEFAWGDDSPVVLTRASTATGVDAVFAATLPLVEIGTVSTGHTLANERLIQTVIGRGLRYVSHDITESDGFSTLTITQASRPDDVHAAGLRATLRLRAARGVAGFTSTVTVSNDSDDRSHSLVSVPSFVTAFGTSPELAEQRDQDASEDPLDDWKLLEGRSDWLGESRWHEEPLRGVDFPTLAQQLTGHDPRSARITTSTGTWSTGAQLPLAAVSSERRGLAWLWQIEHNGPWRWEVGENTASGYLALSGPTDVDHQWLQRLAPGQEFTSVPVTVVLAPDLDGAVASLTQHRRATRRSHPDNRAMPVVFNDYMNTLNGDPTTAKLLPLIDAAAEAGAETFCIDAGWYDDSGDWWDSVGEWKPSTTRFPGGLGEVIERILGHGMVPGLWLEPEVVGVESAVADRLPREAFLQRHGERVREHDRYHLDLRHPAAVAHLDEVVDRLVNDFGVGFFKLDYNIDPGSGTDLDADSVGSGLLGHNRAHLAWIDGVLDRHPRLVLENCGSGAMRMDGAMLSRLQLQSTSDQQDFVRYPPIAAAAPLAMLPEQAASWAYPQPEMSLEQVSFCLATGILGRFYLSGYLNRMDDDQLALVREAVALAKQIRPVIARSTPEWPLGLPTWTTPTVALALRTPETTLTTVWSRQATSGEIALAFPHLAGVDVHVTTVFPVELTEWPTRWDRDAGVLHVTAATASPSARTFSLEPSTR